ncbi:hypothetical protein DFS34DRAFT_681698 [Phlyctochytrium arcticum]|nr:hypothetical protein DFS34DRAFT_681698 [Phlyctochytrium arcticum]
MPGFIKSFATVAAASVLLISSSVGASSKIDANQEYDAIFVGLGAANSIAVTKVVQAFPQRRFLVIEKGGPTASSVGGRDFAPYFADAADNRTIFDVPGEYQNIAFQAKGDKYRIQENYAWQGKGAPGLVPQHIAGRMASKRFHAVLADDSQQVDHHQGPFDGRQERHGEITSLIGDAMTEVGYDEADMSALGPLEKAAGYWNEAYVATNGQGERGGPISGWLREVVGRDGEPIVSNLDIIPYATVTRIEFDEENDASRAVGVLYVMEGDKDVQRMARLAARGRVVVGAGALMTTRLLYMSGIGPRGKEDQIFADPVLRSVGFPRNNQALGQLYDHVGMQIIVEYQGNKDDVQTIRYNEYQENAAELAQYVQHRQGPYCQYGPVFVAQWNSGSENVSHPDVEMFLFPITPGHEEFNKRRAFQTNFMLLDPISHTQLGLHANNSVAKPDIYLQSRADQTTMMKAIRRFVNDILPQIPGLKMAMGPQDTNSDKAMLEYFWSKESGGPSIQHHMTGMVPLTEGSAEEVGGADPVTLRVRGTRNVHVIDASILPLSIPAHPIAMVMALGEKGADTLIAAMHSSQSRARTRR